MLTRRSGAMRASPLATVVLAVGLATLAVACSDDDDASGPASTTTAPTATSQAPVVSSTTTTSSTVPPFSEADLEELAAALDVATLVVVNPDGSGVLTWADSRPGRVAVPEDTFAWSDGVTSTG